MNPFSLAIVLLDKKTYSRWLASQYSSCKAATETPANMIPNRPFYYGFIRASIWGLQAVAPAAACYSVARLLGYSFLPRPLEFLAYAEALFYVGVSLPRQWVLHKSRPRPVHRSRKERQELFERSWASIPDHEAFLRVYFKGAPLESIYRDNLKDFLAWGWFYKTKASVDDDDELESFVCQIERDLGRTFQDGRGPCEPLRVSTDPLRIQHKPLFFYAVSDTKTLGDSLSWNIG